MWDRIPVWTAPESAQKGTVAYQVLKVEMSIFSALELVLPGGVSQNHMTDFLKTVPTRNLTSNTRHMSSMHEAIPRGRAQQPQLTQANNLGVPI